MTTMTPTRLRECLKMLRWSQHELARRLGRSEGNIRQMARGTVAVPPEIAGWLEAIAPRAATLLDALDDLMARHPPPTRPE